MKTLWFAFCLLNIAGHCRADRDIVYSARYYAPPGSHRTSHFQLYRINPNGTGKTQLTFGSNDEGQPKWTADGRQITFISYPENSVASALCGMDADGRNRHRLGVVKEDTRPLEPVVPGYRLDNNAADDNSKADKHTLVALKTGRRLTLTVPDHDSSFNSSNDILLPMPVQELVYAANDHNSTVGTDYAFYRLNPNTGTMRYLTEGQFLAWSPDGSRFCVAPGRDTTPYEKRIHPYSVQDFGQTDAQYRMVWAAPLFIHDAKTGKMTQITPRLSYVTGADWRKEK